MKIHAEIRHGNYVETLTVEGDTVDAALASINGNTYLPETGSRGFSTVCRDLAETGRSAWGWADYTRAD